MQVNMPVPWDPSWNVLVSGSTRSSLRDLCHDLTLRVVLGKLRLATLLRTKLGKSAILSRSLNAKSCIVFEYSTIILSGWLVVVKPPIWKKTESTFPWFPMKIWGQNLSKKSLNHKLWAQTPVISRVITPLIGVTTPCITSAWRIIPVSKPWLMSTPLQIA